MLLKVIREAVLVIDAVAAMLFGVLLVALVPGDSLDANGTGAVALMIMLIMLVLVISVPTHLLLRRRGDSLFGGVTGR